MSAAGGGTPVVRVRIGMCFAEKVEKRKWNE